VEWTSALVAMGTVASASVDADASGSGALTSSFHVDGSLDALAFVMYSTVKGATPSAAATPGRLPLLRLHRSKARRARRTRTRPPRTPPTIAAMGGPVCVAEVGWLGLVPPEGGEEEELEPWGLAEDVARLPFNAVDCVEAPFEGEDGEPDEEGEEPAFEEGAEEAEPEDLGFEGLEGGLLPEEDPEEAFPEDADPEEVEPPDVVPEEDDDPDVDPEDEDPEDEDPEDVELPPAPATSLTNSDNWTGRSETLSDTSDMYTASTPRLSSCDITALYDPVEGAFTSITDCLDRVPESEDGLKDE